MPSPQEFLYKLEKDLRVELENPNITYDVIHNFYQKFCNFCDDHGELHSTEVELLGYCSLNYINCIQNHIEQSPICEYCYIEALQVFLAVIKDISQLSGAEVYSQYILTSILKKVVESDMQIWFTKALLRIVIAQGCRANLPAPVVENLPLVLCKLASKLYTCGDYEYQQLLLETIFNVFSVAQIHQYAHEMFPSHIQYKNALCNISANDFDTGCRQLLNIINEDFQQVISINCEVVHLENTNLYAPKVLGQAEADIWADFNLGSRTITIKCDKDCLKCCTTLDISFDGGDFHLLTINVAEICYVSISRLLETDSPVSIGYIMLFKIAGSFRNPSFEIKLVVFNCPQLNEVVRNVLPNWFGEKFERSRSPPREGSELLQANDSELPKLLNETTRLLESIGYNGRVHEPIPAVSMRFDVVTGISEDFFDTWNSLDLQWNEDQSRSELPATPLKPDTISTLDSQRNEDQSGSKLSATPSSSDTILLEDWLYRHQYDDNIPTREKGYYLNQRATISEFSKPDPSTLESLFDISDDVIFVENNNAGDRMKTSTLHVSVGYKKDDVQINEETLNLRENINVSQTERMEVAKSKHFENQAPSNIYKNYINHHIRSISKEVRCQLGVRSSCTLSPNEYFQELPEKIPIVNLERLNVTILEQPNNGQLNKSKLMVDINNKSRALTPTHNNNETVVEAQSNVHKNCMKLHIGSVIRSNNFKAKENNSKIKTVAKIGDDIMRNVDTNQEHNKKGPIVILDRLNIIKDVKRLTNLEQSNNGQLDKEKLKLDINNKSIALTPDNNNNETVVQAQSNLQNNNIKYFIGSITRSNHLNAQEKHSRNVTVAEIGDDIPRNVDINQNRYFQKYNKKVPIVNVDRLNIKKDVKTGIYQPVTILEQSNNGQLNKEKLKVDINNKSIALTPDNNNNETVVPAQSNLQNNHVEYHIGSIIRSNHLNTQEKHSRNVTVAEIGDDIPRNVDINQNRYFQKYNKKVPIVNVDRLNIKKDVKTGIYQPVTILEQSNNGQLDKEKLKVEINSIALTPDNNHYETVVQEAQSNVHKNLVKQHIGSILGIKAQENHPRIAVAEKGDDILRNIDINQKRKYNKKIAIVNLNRINVIKNGKTGICRVGTEVQDENNVNDNGIQYSIGINRKELNDHHSDEVKNISKKIRSSSKGPKLKQVLQKSCLKYSDSFESNDKCKQKKEVTKKQPIPINTEQSGYNPGGEQFNFSTQITCINNLLKTMSDVVENIPKMYVQNSNPEKHENINQTITRLPIESHLKNLTDAKNGYNIPKNLEIDRTDNNKCNINLKTGDFQELAEKVLVVNVERLNVLKDDKTGVCHLATIQQKSKIDEFNTTNLIYDMSNQSRACSTTIDNNHLTVVSKLNARNEVILSQSTIYKKPPKMRKLYDPNNLSYTELFTDDKFPEVLKSWDLDNVHSMDNQQITKSKDKNSTSVIEVENVMDTTDEMFKINLTPKRKIEEPLDAFDKLFTKEQRAENQKLIHTKDYTNSRNFITSTPNNIRRNMQNNNCETFDIFEKIRKTPNKAINNSKTCKRHANKSLNARQNKKIKKQLCEEKENANFENEIQPLSIEPEPTHTMSNSSVQQNCGKLLKPAVINIISNIVVKTATTKNTMEPVGDNSFASDKLLASDRPKYLNEQDIRNWISTGISDAAAEKLQKDLESSLPTLRQFIDVALEALRGPVPANLLGMYKLFCKLEHSLNDI